MKHDKIRLMLEERLREIARRADCTLEPVDGDDADHAFASDSASISTVISANESNEAALIREALARMDAGTYGLCSTCNKKIPAGRLVALPYAVSCVACRERDEG